MTKPINNDVNEKQREAINHNSGPLLIAAGAGSGKTKTLTNRLAKLITNGVPPENIIAITFTNKAAKEMLDRISKFQIPNSKFQFPFVGTFHSLGARILKKEAQLLGRNAAFTIFDNDDSLSVIKKNLKAAGEEKEFYSPAKLQHQFSAIKSDFLDPVEYLDKFSLKYFEQYEKTLAKNNAFDFDDLIQKVVWLFENHPAVLEKYQTTFRHILVDEYQDVNTAQYRLVKLLAQKYKNISVVGDDQQAIYSFRFADFRNFLNFEKDWPEAKIVKLEQNYRSSGNIITAASTIIKNNKLQKPKELWTENPPGELIKVSSCIDADQEANLIASEIQKSPPKADPPRAEKISAKGGSASGGKNQNLGIAILYRTNAQSRAIEQALIAANIPYKIFGGLRFYERKEIKDIVAALRLAANPKDEISAERIIKNFKKDAAANLLSQLPRLGQELSILELINFFIAETDYFEYLAKNYKNQGERIENINELINFAGEFSAKGGSASGGKELSEFLERILLLQSSDTPNDSLNSKSSILNPVNLMSIHLAKGLEFDNIFVIGCNEGLLPHQMSYGAMDQLEEERRLMYVAMTRAKKELCLSFYGAPSRFLYEIPPELTTFTDLGGRKNELPNEDEMYIEE